MAIDNLQNKSLLFLHTIEVRNQHIDTLNLPNLSHTTSPIYSAQK